jgi:hypothetical protein
MSDGPCRPSIKLCPTSGYFSWIAYSTRWAAV